MVEESDESSQNEDGAAPEPDVEVDEPIRSSVTERILAIFVIATMVGAMGYGVWIVVKYWNRVGV